MSEWQIRHVNSVSDVFKILKRPNSADLILTLMSVDELSRRARQMKHGAFDYDGTLVEGSQWRILNQFLPESIRRILDEERAHYFNPNNGAKHVAALQDENWFLDHHEEINRPAVEGAWFASTVSRYRQAELKREQIYSAMEQLAIRNGCRELFELFEQRIIISFGMEQTIQHSIDFHQIKSHIAASRLHFDAEGRVIGFHPNVVVSATKKTALLRFMHLAEVREHELLVMGDSINDFDMMLEKSLNILLIPTTEIDEQMIAFRRGYLKHMWPRLSAILVSNSLFPLVEFILDSRASEL